MIGNWNRLGRYLIKSSKQFFTVMRSHARTKIAIIGPLKWWFRLLSFRNRFATSVSLSIRWICVLGALFSVSIIAGASKHLIACFDLTLPLFKMGLQAVPVSFLWSLCLVVLMGLIWALFTVSIILRLSMFWLLLGLFSRLWKPSWFFKRIWK